MVKLEVVYGDESKVAVTSFDLRAVLGCFHLFMVYYIRCIYPAYSLTSGLLLYLNGQFASPYVSFLLKYGGY